MSTKKFLVRGVAATAALAGALALTLPGVASAADAFPAPELTATVIDGNKLQLTVEDLSGRMDSVCVPAVLTAEAALPLATAGAFDMDALADLGEDEVKFLGVNDMTNIAQPKKTYTTDALPNGAYAAVAACLTMTPNGPEILGFNYEIVLLPSGLGSLATASGLGSTVLQMDGGSALIMSQLGN